MSATTKQVKKVISRDDYKIGLEIAAAEKHIPELEKLRSLAKTICNTDNIDSETGEKEIHEFLSDDTYTAADKIAIASLRGVSDKYRQWLDLKSKFRGLYKYQIKGNKVQINEIWKVDLEREHTRVLYGESVLMHDTLEKLAKEINKASSVLGTDPLSLLYRKNITRHMTDYLINDRKFLGLIQMNDYNNRKTQEA